MSRQPYDPVQHIADNLEILVYGHPSDKTLPERQVKALESIAASLEKMANPPMIIPFRGDPALEAMIREGIEQYEQRAQQQTEHITAHEPGTCFVQMGEHLVLIQCAVHSPLPPKTEAKILPCDEPSCVKPLTHAPPHSDGEAAQW